MRVCCAVPLLVPVVGQDEAFHADRNHSVIHHDEEAVALAAEWVSEIGLGPTGSEGE